YAASHQRRVAMSVEQLFGKYKRLKVELEAAYAEPHWNQARVDRIADEIALVERQISVQAPDRLRASAPATGDPLGTPASALAAAGRRAAPVTPPWRPTR
ncbi:MAG: hypothetical protein ACXWCN_12555, partial [Caldimonas sp.]